MLEKWYLHWWRRPAVEKAVRHGKSVGSFNIYVTAKKMYYVFSLENAWDAYSSENIFN